MLKLTSAGLKELAAVSGNDFAVKRSTGMVATSTVLGVGMAYVGYHQAKKKHNNWWHLLTVAGGLNLLTNGADIVDRISGKRIGA
jgi:hypothetical protein